MNLLDVRVNVSLPFRRPNHIENVGNVVSRVVETVSLTLPLTRIEKTLGLNLRDDTLIEGYGPLRWGF